MRATVLPLIVVLSLGGCATERFDPGGVGPGLVKAYSPDVLARAADEIEALPEGSVLAVMIADYAVLRAQLRAGGGVDG